MVVRVLSMVPQVQMMPFRHVNMVKCARCQMARVWNVLGMRSQDGAIPRDAPVVNTKKSLPQQQHGMHVGHKHLNNVNLVNTIMGQHTSPVPKACSVRVLEMPR